MVLAQELHQQSVGFACIVNELAAIVKTLGIDADDFGGGWAFVKDDPVG